MEDKSQRDSALELFVVLTRAANWTGAHSHRDIRRYGLNPTEFGILELLYHKGQMPLQQIGEKILISSGNITYSIDKLECKHLLARKPAPNDRRVTFAELTEEGHKLLSQIFPPHAEAIHKVMSGLTREEQEQATQLLKKLGLTAEEIYKQQQ